MYTQPVSLLSFSVQKKDIGNNRALDIGCAVGRSAFELAREYKEVIGVDFSEAFIRTSQTLKKAGQLNYSLPVEGDLAESKVAIVDPDIVRV